MLKKNYKKYILLVLIFVFGFLFLGCIDIYIFGSKTFLSKVTIKILPCPLIIVNKSFISISNYEEFLNDFEIYFPDLNKNNLNVSRVIIQNEIIKQFAGDLDIRFNKKEFQLFTKDFYLQNNLLAKEQNYLEENYHWEKDKFEKYIIKPFYYQNKIYQKIKSDEFNKENKIKMEEIYQKILEEPDQFEKLSQEYKDKNININEISWMQNKDLPLLLSEKIDYLDLGEFTNIIKSFSGYHIYKLKGKVKSDNDSFYYKFSQIFLPIKDLKFCLDNKLQESKIYYFLGNKVKLADKN